VVGLGTRFRGAIVPLRAALAGVVALLVVLGIACQAKRPAPTPEVPFSPEDQPVVATGEAEPPGRPERVRVAGAGTAGVNLRAAPGTDGARLKGLFDGAQLELIGPDSTVEGRAWRHVRDPSDRSEGWVAAEFLASP
jgi:Bacterial SH3 domain